jgi:hypothetical protein
MRLRVLCCGWGCRHLRAAAEGAPPQPAAALAPAPRAPPGGAAAHGAAGLGVAQRHHGRQVRAHAARLLRQLARPGDMLLARPCAAPSGLLTLLGFAAEVAPPWH